MSRLWGPYGASMGPLEWVYMSPYTRHPWFLPLFRVLPIVLTSSPPSSSLSPFGVQAHHRVCGQEVNGRSKSHRETKHSENISMRVTMSSVGILCLALGDYGVINCCGSH